MCAGQCQVLREVYICCKQLLQFVAVVEECVVSVGYPLVFVAGFVRSVRNAVSKAVLVQVVVVTVQELKHEFVPS